LVLGACGIGSFFIYEAKFARHPIVPYSLLQNCTSASGYLQTFINSLVSLAITYYLPVYHQACKDASALKSSVNTLSLFVTMAPIIVMAGVSVSITKAYRPQIWTGWAIEVIGLGLLTMTNADTSLSQVMGISALLGIGAGIIFATTYFPVLSPIPVTANAYALAFFSFCRSLAGAWGISIGAAILQNELRTRLPSDFVASLANGGSGIDLTYSVVPQIRDLPQPLKDQVRAAFGNSTAVIWKVMAGIACVGVLASFAMRDVPLHEKVDEKWGLDASNEDGDVEKSDCLASDEKTW